MWGLNPGRGKRYFSSPKRPDPFWCPPSQWGEHQRLSRRNRSTTDHLFCIRQILEKKWEYSETVHHLFIYFKKPYDSVTKEVLYNILTEFGIPMKLVRLRKYLSDTFPIKNGLKQGDALPPLLFNFAFEYAIRRDKANQEGLKLNGTHQFLVYADDVNILGGSMHAIKKNTETLVVASKEIGLDINAEKTKYRVMS